MKRIILILVGVALALLVMKFKPFSGSRLADGKAHAESANSTPAGAGRPVGNPGKSGTNDFQILSDTPTPNGRVIRASKGGVVKELTLPAGVQVSPELVEQGLFAPDPVPVDPELLRQAMRASLNRHLTFYGLVLDEKTNTVAGASIEASVTIADGISPQTSKTMQLVSDADGRFTFEQEWGQVVMFKVSKRPDYIDALLQRFQYGPIGNLPTRHVPNILAPVPFVLTHRKPAEPLVSFSKSFGAPNSGEPVRVDLTTGRLVKEGGDLIVSISCPEPYTELKRFPWKLSVAAVGGGMSEVPSSPGEPIRLEYLHEAPEAGYESGINVEYGPNTESYRVQHDGWFYVKSRSGQNYAKIYFRMNTFWDERGVPFRIEAVVNTNASRNLQTPVGR